MPNRKKKTNKKKKGKTELGRSCGEESRAAAATRAPPLFTSREDISRKLSSAVNPDCLSDKKLVFPVRLENKFVPTYRATVPNGVLPGQSFRVCILGHTSTIVCPAGSGPGQSITLRTSWGDMEPKVVGHEEDEDEDEDEKGNLQGMLSMFGECAFPTDSSGPRTQEDFAGLLANIEENRIPEDFYRRFKTKIIEAGVQSLAGSTKQAQADRDILLSIVRDWSEKDKEATYALSNEQISDLLIHLYDGIAKVVNGRNDDIILPEFENPVCKKFYLQKIADKEIIRSTMANILVANKMHKFCKKSGDQALKASYRQAKKELQKDDALNPYRQCSGCLKSKSVSELRKCSQCSSVFYCSRECQVKHWKNGHKKQCLSLAAARARASQPESPDAPNIPFFVLALSPSLTNYPKEVHLLMPIWDHDEKTRRDLSDSSRAKHQSLIVNDLKKFFKLERLGAETPVDMVGNMCVDALTLFFLGYKGSDGCAIRHVSKDEYLDTKREKPSMTYRHYTPVPKGWTIPAEDRPFIDPHVLAELEKGIESVRKKLGERDAL